MNIADTSAVLALNGVDVDSLLITKNAIDQATILADGMQVRRGPLYRESAMMISYTGRSMVSLLPCAVSC